MLYEERMERGPPWRLWGEAIAANMWQANSDRDSAVDAQVKDHLASLATLVCPPLAPASIADMRLAQIKSH